MGKVNISSQPQLVKTRDRIREVVALARAEGKRIGLVPTMGALHEGHLSLVVACKAECDVTVVSVFVNQAQFAAGEDFERYPRELAADMEVLGRLGAEWVFAPGQEEMYSDDFSTYVQPPSVADPWEGRCRVNHFRGVATVVLKLMNIIPADTAYFGQKDYQQAVVIRRMVEDLNLPIRLVVCPIVRDQDGLAMSSRNAYLTDSQRVQAKALSQSLARAAELVADGERDAATVTANMRRVVAVAGITRVDYIALVHPETLEEVRTIGGPTVALIAAYVGDTRLIDNRVLELVC